MSQFPSLNCSILRSGRRRGPLALVALGASSFMITLDTTIVNLALPTIGAAWKANLSELQWIASAYIMVFASVLLTAGTITDKLGARRVFLTALGFFTAASVGCGLAEGIIPLVVARAVQGLGAAAILPSSMALLADAYPDTTKRGRAVGIWSTISASALVVGPPLGGLLVETLGWRSIFLINLPVGLIVLATAAVAVGAPVCRQRAFDWHGQSLSAVALISMTFVGIEGNQIGWASPVILGPVIAAVISSVAFVIIERRCRHPMLPVELFRSKAFTTSVVISFVYNIAYYGGLFVLSLALQESGISPLRVGILFAPMTLSTAVMAFLCGRLVARFGTMLLISAGMGLGAVGTALLLTLGLSPWTMLIAGAFIGAGGASLPAIVATMLGNVPDGRAGIGSGVLNAGRQVGGALGVAILGSLLGNASPHRLELTFAALTLSFVVGAVLSLIGLEQDEGRADTQDRT